MKDGTKVSLNVIHTSQSVEDQEKDVYGEAGIWLKMKTAENFNALIVTESYIEFGAR